MNTKNLKAYAPKARRQFIAAVKNRAAQFGIYEDRIEEVRIEGSAAIIEGRAFTRKQGEQRKQLEKRVTARGYDVFIREMAYTWFNRLAAIRYMELHDYLEHGFRVLSPAKHHPANSDGLPEILGHASDVADSLDLDKSHIIELQLAGDKEEQLYRELLLGQCHHLYKIMPFMFEQLDDATELLLPDSLTKTDSILKDLVADIPEEDWREIEVIGWLYQFYISEHKDSVIGMVVKSEDIPAATQLFTPNWIVKYLVQNSLGRQWLATYPDSELKSKMEYYIEPAEQTPDVIEQLKAITPASIDPEQIKVLDPAAGSGHILVEIYEVLREIYLERGYRLREIPELILTKNIYGLDIDDRAAQLAGFALMMKAREDDRRIFQRVQDGDMALNVYSLQSTEGLDVQRLWSALDLEDKHQKGSTGGLFDAFDQRETFEYPADDEMAEAIIPVQAGIYSRYYQLLQTLKSAFLQAKTLGSLIQIDNQHLANLLALTELLVAKQQSSDPAAKQAAIELIPIFNQAIALAQQYDVVVANPPYMGIKYMNTDLKNFAKQNLPDSKSDLFSLMKENSFNMLVDFGYSAMIVMESWMFLSSYQKFRENLLNNNLICDLIHMPYNGRGRTSLGINFGTSASIIRKLKLADFNGHFSCISFYEIDENGVPLNFPVINERTNLVNSNAFKVIPASPIAYSMNDEVRQLFKNYPLLKNIVEPRPGLSSTNNEKFLRYWFEVAKSNIGFGFKERNTALTSELKWFPFNKGGDARRWFGNNDYIVNWKSDGADIKKAAEGASGGRVVSEEYYFEKSVSVSAITSADNSCRFYDDGALFDVNFRSYFRPENVSLQWILAFLNSSVSKNLLSYISPTVALNKADLERLPYIQLSDGLIEKVDELIAIARKDWDMFERSYNFKVNPIVSIKIGNGTIEKSFNQFMSNSDAEINNVIKLEHQIDSEFSQAYGIQNNDNESRKVTLDINPNYRFSDDPELSLLKYQCVTIQELLSYSLGLMMGRYSLGREGLVYAHAGNEGFKELAAEGVYQTFPADDDGIIPLASEDWLFDDDATTRFREFVKTVWGAEHLSENLEFVAQSLCLHALKPKKGEGTMDTIRRYYSTQFFKDHCKTYKKRPIYWLFSSGKEKAFECLIYLHRYNEGTLSRMRTEYVTPLMGKYDAQHTLLAEQQIQATGTEARIIEKDLKALDKKQAELRTFDEQLKHYAEMRITLDLDDGVKANYGKFGNLLADVKAIHGQAVK